MDVASRMACCGWLQTGKRYLLNDYGVFTLVVISQHDLQYVRGEARMVEAEVDQARNAKTETMKWRLVALLDPQPEGQQVRTHRNQW